MSSTRIPIRYNGIGGLDPLELAARLRLSSRPATFEQALREAKQARKQKIAPEVKAEKYLAVCRADLLKHPLEAAEFALEVMRLVVPSHYKEVAAACLCGLAEQAKNLPPRTKQDIKQQLRTFMTSQSSLGEMRQYSYALKSTWAYILTELFVTEFLDWQEALVRDAYQEIPTRSERFRGALSYLSLARIGQQSGQTRLFDPENIEAAVTFLVEKNPQLLASRTVCQDDFFHHLVINLLALDKWAELEKSLKLRQPDKDDPIWLVVNLEQARRLNGIEAAFARLREILPLTVEVSPLIKAELERQRVLISGSLFDTLTKPVGQSEPNLGLNNPWQKQALARPAGEFPSLHATIVDLRRDILKIGTEPVRNCQEGLTKRSFDEFDRAETADLAIGNRNARQMQLYLYCQGGTYVKTAFHFDSIREDGGFKGATGRAVFEGRTEADADQVPLGWEIRALRGLIACKEPPPELFVDRQRAIEMEVHRLASRLFETSNRSTYLALAAQLNAEPEFQDSLLVELENRLRISRLILGQDFSVQRPVSFNLDKEDLLNGLIKNISLVPANQFDQSFELTGRRGKLGVLLEPVAGAPIWALVNEKIELEIIGVRTADKDLAAKYLLGLTLETLAKEQWSGNGARKPGAASYVIDPEQRFGSDVSHGLKALINILSRQFRRRLASHGIMAEVWYCQSNGLFRPLTDQSQNNKETARQTYGDKGLFVTAVPVCIKSRLPVREKIVEGVKILAPYDPDPQRLEQARLIGDNQTARTRFALYLVTIFSNGASHLKLMRIADAEAGLDQGGYLAQLESEISRGDFHVPQKLLEHDRSAKRNDLLRALTSGTVQITKQETRVWRINYNLARPHFVPIADLLGQGYPLTV